MVWVVFSKFRINWSNFIILALTVLHLPTYRHWWFLVGLLFLTDILCRRIWKNLFYVVGLDCLIIHLFSQMCKVLRRSQECFINLIRCPVSNTVLLNLPFWLFVVQVETSVPAHSLVGNWRTCKSLTSWWYSSWKNYLCLPLKQGDLRFRNHEFEFWKLKPIKMLSLIFKKRKAFSKV